MEPWFEFVIKRDYLADIDRCPDYLDPKFKIEFRIFDENDYLHWDGFMTQELWDSEEHRRQPLKWAQDLTGCPMRMTALNPETQDWRKV